MTRLVLTVLALTIALASPSAHAGGSAKKIELTPSKLLGSWCGTWAYNFPDAPEDVHHLWWAKDVEECANRGGIRYGKSGYEYHRFGLQGSCRYTRVELATDNEGLREEEIQPKRSDGKLAREMVRPGASSDVFEASCKDNNDNSHWNESFYTQSVRGWLIREDRQGWLIRQNRQEEK
jgi:hypothetical protein